MICGLAPIAVGASVQIIEYPTGATSREWLVAGPDNALWFGSTSGSNNYLERLQPGATPNFYSLPNTLIGGGQVGGVTVGPDGNIWFADYKCAIGRSTLTGSITEFYESPCGTPLDIVTSDDGNLWFTDSTNSSIGRMTTAGAMTMYQLPTSGANPQAIVKGPDGNMWFTEMHAGQIGRITKSGVITEFPPPPGTSIPYGITVGPDRNLWFSESGGLGKITPVGVITEVTLPVGVYHITSLGHALWFTDGQDDIARYDVPSGRFISYAMLANSSPTGIAPGPGADKDRDVWFIEQGTDQLAEFIL
jgi:virginiamycin B lyase